MRFNWGQNLKIYRLKNIIQTNLKKAKRKYLHYISETLSLQYPKWACNKMTNEIKIAKIHKEIIKKRNKKEKTWEDTWLSSNTETIRTK